MKPSPLENILPLDDGGGDDGDDKPSIGDALGENYDEQDDGSNTEVTAAAKKECGEKLLEAFKSNDPIAMFNAVAGAQDLVDKD